MKKNNYKEKTPEPKDYGGSEYSDDHNPSLWAAAGRDDNDLYYWEEVTKEPTPKGPNGSIDPDGGSDGNNSGDQAMTIRLESPHVLCGVPPRYIGSLRVCR
jgi:hypothetical protein